VGIRADELVSEEDFDAMREEQKQTDDLLIQTLQDRTQLSSPKAIRDSPQTIPRMIPTVRTKPARTSIDVDTEYALNRPTEAVLPDIVRQQREIMNTLKEVLKSNSKVPDTPSPPIRDTRTPLINSPPSSFYAIGATGEIPGVYATLAEVKDILAMDPNTKPQVRKFTSEAEASQWVEHQCIMRETSQSPRISQGGNDKMLEPPSYQPRTQGLTNHESESELRSFYDHRPVKEIQQELDIDRSRGKENAAFGTPILNEQDAEELLSPTDLPEAAEAKLRGKILDSTALPNLTLPTSSEAEESLLASSLLIVATTQGGDRDPQVHLPKRTALYNVKSLKSLQRLSKQLSKAAERA